MTALVVVLMFAVFVALDLVVRSASRRMQEKRARKEREAVLQTSLKLDFTHEAKSLKRVEVPAPKARILAVDDEPVILDSFRKILVVDGYSVDTVETGQEALGLVQRNDYDFVFTDLKMPGMDGVEVVRGVKHLRPDTDVAVITGYATIESAVQTMSHGAIDYVQKPFTAEELSQFARRLLIKRQARHAAQRLPSVRVVAPALADVAHRDEYCVPGVAFLSGAHVWARIEPSGVVRIGLDDFARKALGPAESVDLPRTGVRVKRDDALFTLRRGDRQVRFTSPMSGEITQVNAALGAEPGRIDASPYDRGWICLLRPADLAAELPALHIGRPVLDWYRDEIARLTAEGGAADQGSPQVDWRVLEEKFFAPAAATVRA